MPNPIDVKIGANIRARRTLLGLSQEALAKSLPEPVTFQQIQKYERGTNRVCGSKMLYIANALKCTVSDLYDSVEDGAKPTESTRAELELMRSFRSLPISAQVAVRSFVVDIAGSLPTQRYLEGVHT